VNWEVEIDALRDISFIACEAHRIVAEGLWEWCRLAADRHYGAHEQKVLTAKIAAESIAALEDLGALAWSVSNRGNGGIIRNYLSYKPKNVDAFYKRVGRGESLGDMLKLPRDDEIAHVLGEDDRELLRQSLAELQRVFEVAAKDYLELDGKLVVTYNKIKHGFVVIHRLDKLVPGAKPPTNWEQDVNVLTGIRANGSVLYTALERSAGMLESLMAVIKMSGSTSRELASLVIYLFEHGVDLDVRP